MMREILTFPGTSATIVIRCLICKWPFHCPIEQAERIKCRACESKT